MGRLLAHRWLRETLTAAGLALCALALVCHPREISAAVRQGLELCGNVILPALFPFFILTSLVISLGLAGLLGRLLEPVMRPVFHLGGSCAAPLALGFIGGYPVGARAALSLFRAGQCSRTEAERLLAFCNNSGPAFILGVVGSGVFGDSRVGLLLCLTHAAASLCVGFLFRFYRRREDGSRSGPDRAAAPIAAVRFPAAFTAAVGEALTASLNICAFVVCFTVILRLCVLTGLLPALAGLLGRLGLARPQAEQLLTGLLELSSGVASLRGPGSLEGRLSLAAFLLGWAGLSVHCQVLSFLADSGLSCRTYLAGKLLHGLISAGFTALLFRLLPFSLPAGVWLSQQTEGLAGLDGPTALIRSLTWAWLLFLSFLLAGAYSVKRTGKTGRSML